MLNIFIAYISDNWIGILATLVGLMYLYYEYKASIRMWPASIIMALFYVYIFYSTQLYASASIYLYFLLASVYGWFVWVKRNREVHSGEHIISHVPKRLHLPIFISILVLFLLITVLLHLFTENSVILLIGDALTTSLNIIALWMASRKWAEQWCLLIPANAVSCVLLIMQNEIESAVLFLIYFIVSVFGYFNWVKLANKTP